MAASPPENDPTPASGTEDLRASLALAAKTGGPFKLGDFEIDGNGRLRPRPDGEPIAFGFSYLGIDFMAKLDTGEEGRLSLDAELGKLPYRAEIGARRKQALQIVRASRRLRRGGIELSQTLDMHLTAALAPIVPLTPTAVLTALTAILLDFKPYLVLLHEAMLAPLAPEAEPEAPAP